MDQRNMPDIKPLAHIEMLRKNNNQYKARNKQLEESNKSINETLLKVEDQLEREKTRVKLLEDENRELKMKLFNTTLEMQKYKRMCESQPQMGDLEEPPIELPDSDEEMELENPPEIQSKQFQNLFQCTQCPKTYLQEKRFISHMKKHSEGSTAVPITPVQRGKKCTIQYKCNEPGCTFTCPYKPAYNRHLNAHRLPTYECPMDGCNYKSPYEKRIRNHMENKHREIMEDFTLPDGNEVPFSLNGNPDFVNLIRNKIEQQDY